MSKRFLYPFPETGYRYKENELFKLVDAYPTCVKGLIATRSLHNKNMWVLTHEPTGLKVPAIIGTLKLVKLAAGVLSGVDGWDADNQTEIQANVWPRLKDAGLDEWLKSFR